MYAAGHTARSFIDVVPQLDYEASIDSEKVFTTFTNACAQAGAARCFPAGLIQGNATGSDVHLLFTSTIDVSLALCMHVSRVRLTLGRQLALKLQRVGYTGLPAQSGELKCKLHRFHLWYPSEGADERSVYSQRRCLMPSSSLYFGQRLRTSSSIPSSSRS